jgi:2-polyprenyl-3-methyl-5-hydroxy-6-metoxy-1,4-benzoquinol methylase
MSNEFYDSITPYYHHIFPLSDAKVEMVKRCIENNDTQKLLDIGCATGEFACAISKYVKDVNGFDLDDEMIAFAKKNQTEYESNVTFDMGNMLELRTMYDESFDMVTCFGNTLVHLQNKQIKDVFKQIYDRLEEDGIFISQILNYDYVYDKKVSTLPLIENEYVRFDRTYDLIEEDQLFFNTRLLVKESGKVNENRIPLYPIRKEEVEQYLCDAGFKELNFYKNYNQDEFGGDHLPLIFIAKK